MAGMIEQWAAGPASSRAEDFRKINPGDVTLPADPSTMSPDEVPEILDDLAGLLGNWSRYLAGYAPTSEKSLSTASRSLSAAAQSIRLDVQ